MDWETKSSPVQDERMRKASFKCNSAQIMDKQR